jgi:hypothetical protein
MELLSPYRRRRRGFLVFMILCSAIWVVSSIIGVYSGRFLRAKRTANLPKWR